MTAVGRLKLSAAMLAAATGLLMATAGTGEAQYHSCSGKGNMCSKSELCVGVIVETCSTIKITYYHEAEY